MKNRLAIGPHYFSDLLSNGLRKVNLFNYQLNQLPQRLQLKVKYLWLMLAKVTKFKAWYGKVRLWIEPRAVHPSRSQALNRKSNARLLRAELFQISSLALFLNFRLQGDGR